jgi:hypothetical protein
MTRIGSPWLDRGDKFPDLSLKTVTGFRPWKSVNVFGKEGRRG